MSRPVRAVLATALVSLTLLSGCSTESSELAEQASAGDNKSYISGDGEIVRYAPEDRLEPVTLSGPTVTGDEWSLEDQRGSVVVLNKWGSWCPPCVEETPELVAAWEEIQSMDAPVTMVGLNFRESPQTGAAFAARYGMTYPSLADEDGILPLELQGRAQATPTTLVIDQEGRIAATVAGPLTRATLIGLVEDVLQDGDGGGDG
ncbi:redoxin domain-containing protein [Nostocoides sp. F2B08]|uniref:TlpA family protein disulfide reductase n=1 Tax=Nostocoides sp. F2B08 TaxID=2653936 RepID=UPI001262FA80|nr:TlpA disulfide reductase family protein [Tetrasphaera sp. F2B08]KAB7746449.1 redoxin domain-containing protein [Tetrasphaera sp. F2B08]